MKRILLLALIINSTFLILNSQAQEVAQDPKDVNPLLIGSTVPEVSVRNMEGETVSLREMAMEKPTVLLFYRGGWCPFCNRHLAEINNVDESLIEEGYQLLAISPDRPEKLSESSSKHSLNYTLLSDSPADAMKAFGIAFRLDDGTFDRYIKNGIDIEADSGYEHHLLPVPAIFIINKEGTIVFQYVNPDYRTRINSELLMTAARVYK